MLATSGRRVSPELLEVGDDASSSMTSANSGHRGIYPSQRLMRRKHGGPLFAKPITLRDYRDALPKRPPPE